MQKKLYALMVAGLLCSMTGCNSFVYDDLSKCPQGVDFSFYRQTPCENRPSYPADIKEVRVFAFDKAHQLVAEYETVDLTLSDDYLLRTPFNQIGTFTFVAWGGTDLDSYNFTAFTLGKTTKEEMFASLKRQTTEFTDKPKPLYYSISKPLTIEERSKTGSVFDLVSFNMKELTNRLHFTIHGLSENEDFSVVIADNNGVYDFNADFAKDSRFNYRTAIHRDGAILKADFVLMKLAEGHETKLTIQNTTTGKVIYSVDLVKDLIMYRGDSGEPPYNLECDHNYDIIIVFGTNPDDQTFMLLRVVINDWNVISRPVILG